jgi:hypothetical protein
MGFSVILCVDFTIGFNNKTAKKPINKVRITKRNTFNLFEASSLSFRYKKKA